MWFDLDIFLMVNKTCFAKWKNQQHIANTVHYNWSLVTHAVIQTIELRTWLLLIIDCIPT